MDNNLEEQFLSISKSSYSVDTMIIETIGLLDNRDKLQNKYAKRIRYWYGCHFPELSKIIKDEIQYVKSVKLMGNRIKSRKLDFSEILESKVEAKLKKAALESKGEKASDIEIMRIQELCDEFLSLTESRAQLYDNLKSGMNNVAPNLTALVGELVGARMITHKGSLQNLAKLPGSTIQILGAEKAMSRALKTKHDTPKYGFIYHSPLVLRAAPKYKGKIARSLAAKAALAIRIDYLGDGQNNTMGLANRAKLEARLRNYEATDLAKSMRDVLDEQFVISFSEGDE